MALPISPTRRRRRISLAWEGGKEENIEMRFRRRIITFPVVNFEMTTTTMMIAEEGRVLSTLPSFSASLSAVPFRRLVAFLLLGHIIVTFGPDAKLLALESDTSQRIIRSTGCRH